MWGCSPLLLSKLVEALSWLRLCMLFRGTRSIPENQFIFYEMGSEDFWGRILNSKYSNVFKTLSFNQRLIQLNCKKRNSTAYVFRKTLVPSLIWVVEWTFSLGIYVEGKLSKIKDYVISMYKQSWWTIKLKSVTF